jgi:hypothetical protein
MFSIDSGSSFREKSERAVLLHGVSQSVHQGLESLCDVCSMFANFDLRSTSVQWRRPLPVCAQHHVQYSTVRTVLVRHRAIDTGDDFR